MIPKMRFQESPTLTKSDNADDPDSLDVEFKPFGEKDLLFRTVL